MFTYLAVAFFIIGLLNLWAKDLVWELTGSGSRIEGLPAERNASWDLWMNLSGAVAVVLGIICWNL